MYSDKADEWGCKKEKEAEVYPASVSNGFLSAVGEFIQYTAFDLIQVDPHQWSERPCSTCKVISALIKRPFGCVLYAKQKGR